ncbi:MAG: RAD55 family ATPase, partial [Thermoplasmata archaeon]
VLPFRPFSLGVGVSVSLTSATLLLAAVLFLISGQYRHRALAAGQQTPNSALPAPGPSSHFSPDFSPQRDVRSVGTAATPVLAPALPRPVRAAMAAELPAPSVSGRWPDVVSTGFHWLDELLLGGFQRRAQLALVGEAGLGSEKVVWGTLTESLRRGESIVIVTTSWTVREIAEQMERFSPGFTDFDRGGRVLWVDASGKGSAARSDPLGIVGPGDSIRILGAVRTAATQAERQSPRGFTLGFLGVSSLVDAVGDPMALAVLRNAVAILRGFAVVVTYSVDLRGRPGPAVRSLLDEVDGTLLFQSLKGGTFVKVFRLGPVESRGWVPCRYYDRGLELAPSGALRERGHGGPVPDHARPAYL